MFDIDVHVFVNLLQQVTTLVLAGSVRYNGLGGFVRTQHDRYEHTYSHGPRLRLSDSQRNELALSSKSRDCMSLTQINKHYIMTKSA